MEILNKKSKRNKVKGNWLLFYIIMAAFPVLQFCIFYIGVNIKSNIAENKKELAKKFLQFCYTDEALDLFSYYTETARSLNYKISDTTYNSMGYFGKQYIDFVKNSNWVLPQGNNNLYKENSSTFTPGYFASSIIKGDEIWHVINAFTNYNISGEDYFKGHIALRNEAQWNVLIKK